MINRLLTLFIPCMVLMSTSAAHAGMLNFMDDIFTFREDQKERVMPRRNAPPKIVYTPHYDQQEAAEWARLYTRDDLVATDYMPGSASKVMRPVMDNPRGSYQSGYQAIQRRDRQNRARTAQEDNRIYIGDPGTSPEMDYYSGNKIGAKTRISKPIANWRDEEGDWRATSRRGDYDYLAQQQRRQHTAPYPDDSHVGKEVTSSTYAQPLRPRQTRPNFPAPQTRDAQGRPLEYGVEKGDTLSGISEKDTVYGNWQLWPLIYDANRAQINDPDRIYPGQQLGIPRGWSNQQAQDARGRALQKQAPFLPNDGR